MGKRGFRVPREAFFDALVTAFFGQRKVYRVLY